MIHKLGFWIENNKTRVVRCSSCLTKGAIKNGDLHLCVDGLLFLREKDIVVETKLRFCAKASCARNIKGTMNNIREIQSNMKITCSQEIKDSFSLEEENKLFTEGFTIE